MEGMRRDGGQKKGSKGASKGEREGQKLLGRVKD